MTVITICEQSQTDTGFEVSLVIDGSNYLVALSDPFDSVQEEELEWYFEEWLRYPILDRVKAERVKANINQYGEALFEQLFEADNRVYAKYRQLIENCDRQLQIEIESTNPKFHAIHWEALKDSALPRPLLNYLREWWQVTKFAKKIFYFGYDKAAYTLEQIVLEIGKQIYNRYEFGTFQAQSLTVQWRKLADKLRAESHILILDNLESITGQALAIPNTLDETAREEIKKFLFSLANGKTKVILGSRIQEEWLQPNTFRDNIYQLRGLDVQARSDLAEKMIKQVNSSQSLDELEADEDFERLMNLLAGYPLAMEVVLANLKNQTPQEILENLAKANIDPGGEDKTNNILKCIEYSHSNLSKPTRETLLFFAPFKGFIFTLYLNFYVTAHRNRAVLLRTDQGRSLGTESIF